MPEVYNDSIFWIETDRIHPNPYQPRREFDETKLNELAESIRQYGLLQPITVTRKETPLENGGLSVEYELIAGERRLRAAKIAGLVQIPAIIRTAEDTEQMKLELAIIENLQREDLNPIDRARAFRRLIDEFKFKHSDIGKRIGKSREYITNCLRLLMLPEDVQQLIAERKISDGHTRPVLMLNHKPEEQAVLVKEIVMKKLTVRESEAIARRAAQEKVRNRSYINPDLMEIEKNLTEQLGTRVHIEPREVGGRLVISYFSRDDLNHIIEAMHVMQAGVAAQQFVDANREAEAAPSDAPSTQPVEEKNDPAQPQSQSDTEREQAVGEERRDAEQESRQPQVETEQPYRYDDTALADESTDWYERAYENESPTKTQPQNDPARATFNEMTAQQAAAPEQGYPASSPPPASTEPRERNPNLNYPEMQSELAAENGQTAADRTENESTERERMQQEHSDDADMYSVRNFTI